MSKGRSTLLLAVCLVASQVSTATSDQDECRRSRDPLAINSTVKLPCFERAAGRGVSMSIVMPYNISAEIEAWEQGHHPKVIGFLTDNGTLHIEDLAIQPNVTLSHISLEDYSDRVTLRLYHRGAEGHDDGVKLELDPATLESTGLNVSRPTKVIIHDYMQTYMAPSIQRIKNAYLASGDVNMILVDWSHQTTNSLYCLARRHAAGIGDFLGQYLRYLVSNLFVDPENLHLIGYGLGAHIAGFAGKLAHADGWGVFRITGLEPSYPYFSTASPAERLDRNDADIVDVIHTCTGYFGHPDSLGHLDFFPNEGKKQPGCVLDVLGTCSHARALDLFAESILNKDGFIAKLCDDKCTAEPPVAADTCLGSGITAVMGEWVQLQKEGRYILRTADSTPFGVGLDQYYPRVLRQVISI